MAKGDMVELGALWISKTQNGDTYLSGSVNQNMRVLVFKNRKRDGHPKDPDYRIYLAPNDREQQGSRGRGGGAPGRQQQSAEPRGRGREASRQGSFEERADANGDEEEFDFGKE